MIILASTGKVLVRWNIKELPEGMDIYFAGIVELTHRHRASLQGGQNAQSVHRLHGEPRHYHHGRRRLLLPALLEVEGGESEALFGLPHRIRGVEPRRRHGIQHGRAFHAAWYDG